MALIEDSGEVDEERLFVSIYPGLRRFAAVVGPTEVDPDDLLQEAAARVLKRGSLCDLDEPVAYLKRTIINLASNHRRTLGRARTALSRMVSSREPRSDTYPSDLADLMTLPPHERAVLYLTEVEGYRYAEVAEILGCSEEAARKRAMRGRRRLQIVLVGEVADG